ncbi:MAG: DegT/DnrJ/EryC1/StrS family aminotransferase [Desulfobacterales bacterium]
MPGFEIFSDEERQQVNDVLETGVLFRYGFDHARNGNWKAKTFEKELSEKIGARYCHLCSSGTAALSIALAACGIGAGDEVVVPPFTFVATIESVLNAGAIPVFSEIDNTLCLDPSALENVLTNRTRAILPVHMCGSMAKIGQIRNFCDQKGLVLIEDACQAIGGSYNGKSLGCFGNMGCFSFDPVKTITCGEGGAVVTNNENLYRIADAYADHGHDHMGDDRGKEKHFVLGANYRISELNAAVGLAQLRKLDVILDKQRTHKAILKKALDDCPKVSFREVPDPTGDSATFLSFFLPDEHTARKAADLLNKEGVDGCFYWYDNNWHYFRQWEHLKNLSFAAEPPIMLLNKRPDYSKVSLPRSDKIVGRTISMLIKLSWNDKDIDLRSQKMVRILNSL